jgi:hypothetical protein
VHLAQALAVAVVKDCDSLGKAVEIVIEFFSKAVKVLGCQRLERFEEFGVFLGEAVVIS